MADNTLDKLKQKPKDQRVAIAEGIAISVVIILLIAWAIYFFNKIQSGAQQVSLDSGAQDDFNFTSVREAQQQLQNTFGNVSSDLQELRDRTGGGGTMQMQNVDVGGNDTDAFTDGTNQ